MPKFRGPKKFDAEAEPAEVMPQIEPFRPTQITKHTRVDLTDELIERIAFLVSKGNTIPVACQALGYGDRYKDWLRYGRQHIEKGLDTPQARFVQIVDQGKAHAESSWVSMVVALGFQDWRAYAWLLERRFGIRWAPKQDKNKLPGEGDDTAGKSTDELKALLLASIPGTSLPGATSTPSLTDQDDKPAMLLVESKTGDSE